MSYDVKIIADSVAPHGVRLTTMQVVFPRFILAEMNTHRVFSRNSASSRAIPPEKLIERVQQHPFVPEFNRRVKGMGFGEMLTINDQDAARRYWLSAARSAVLSAKALMKLDVDKARVNRLLEPFLWHTALITSTEWSNFFALRQPDNDDPVPQDTHGAQPEFQIVARMMRDAMRTSEPEPLDYGEWHLPYIDAATRAAVSDHGAAPVSGEYLANVSAGRCFVVSYDRLDEILGEDPAKSFERAERGRKMGHWSPLEHPAMAVKHRNNVFEDWHGNFYGWKQLRKFYEDEDDYSKILARAVAEFTAVSRSAPR